MPMETASAIGPAMAREPRPRGRGVREVAAGIGRLFVRTGEKPKAVRVPADAVDD